MPPHNNRGESTRGVGQHRHGPSVTMGDEYVHCDVEREIDGVWFACVLLKRDAAGVTVQYPECDGGFSEEVCVFVRSCTW